MKIEKIIIINDLEDINRVKDKFAQKWNIKNKK
jgi:hypothetical protein